MARAGMGTAVGLVAKSSGCIEKAVDGLGELRGLGTKVGQMAGLVEASLSPEMRAQIGPALARLRVQAMRSPYEGIAQVIEEDLGAAPELLFARFEREPFASASLGQVYDAEHHDGRHLAVKVKHPGIGEAFRNDLSNVAGLGRIATSFFMPKGQGRLFFDGVKAGFLAELDYALEAEHLRTFAGLLKGDAVLELPTLVPELSSPRVLTTTFLEGEVVEQARAYDDDIRRTQAAAIRRLLLSASMDHGWLYADTHAGNFLFRPDGSLGVLDFGSVLRFDEDRREALVAMRGAIEGDDERACALALDELLQVGNVRVAAAMADIQWLALGGLVRGDAIDDERIRTLTTRIPEMKKKLLGERFALPSFMPFLMRAVMGTNALLAALGAPESGPLTRLPGS